LYDRTDQASELMTSRLSAAGVGNGCQVSRAHAARPEFFDQPHERRSPALEIGDDLAFHSGLDGGTLDDVLVDQAEPDLLRRGEPYLRAACAFLARDADDVVSHCCVAGDLLRGALGCL